MVTRNGGAKRAGVLAEYCSGESSGVYLAMLMIDYVFNVVVENGTG